MAGNKFITIEGGEGAGKSTQARLLAESLETQYGQRVLLTREPGGSPGAELIRNLLLDPEKRWDGITEVMLFLAARRDHMQRTIGPAIAGGSWVICDRFCDSTLAYQGHARGLSTPVLIMLNRFVLDNRMPDMTVVLDVPVEIGFARRRQRDEALDRFEAEDRAFHERVRRGFLDIAVQNPHRCFVVDASQSKDEVHHLVRMAVRDRFGTTRLQPSPA